MLTLLRYNSDVEYTQGMLLKDGAFLCDTLELPWKDNAHNVSCIPKGTYSIHYRENHHAHIPYAYEVENVPDRSGILIHTANRVAELEGCIAVGLKCGFILELSRVSFTKLFEVVGEKSSLLIRGV